MERAAPHHHTMAGEVDPLRVVEQLAALEISSRSTFAKSMRAGADEVHGGKGGEGDDGGASTRGSGCNSRGEASHGASTPGSSNSDSSASSACTVSKSVSQ